MALRKAEAARQLNVSKARISQYVKAGMPVETDGTIDLERAKAWIAANVDPARSAIGRAARTVRGPTVADSAGPGAELVSLSAERTRKLAVEAEMAELQLAKLKAELVDRRAVEQRVEELARWTRNRVLEVPREVAADCARLGDEIAIEGRITLALKAVFDALVREVASGLGQPAAGG